jgi:predicted PurR-regulated permease PerM
MGYTVILMQKKSQTPYFLLIALGASVVLLFFIAKPFLGALILAAVFAYLFQPIYRRFLSLFRGQRSLAAFFTTPIVIILVLLPIALLGSQILREAIHLYQYLVREGGSVGSVQDLLNQARAILPIPASIETDAGQYAKQGLEFMIRNFGAVFSSFAKMLVGAIVFLFAFYYFLKDGDRLREYAISLSPLDDADDELILSRLKSAVSAAVKGNLAIGIIQGALTGIGFAIFGVPNAALWGGVAAVAAFLPGIGTSLVITPAVIYLFLTGNTFGAVGLLAWGVLAVGLIDNLLGPRLVGRGMELHPLAVFIAVLGGLAFFGPLGFLLGPLAVSIFLGLTDIYISFKARNSKASA